MKRILGICVVLLSATLLLWAASEGPTFPGTGADDDAIGTDAWLNPDRITASDDSRAAKGSLASGTLTHYLKGTNFGFSNGVNGTIDGLLCEVEQYGTATGGATVPTENSIRLVNGAGTIVGDNKSTSASLPTDVGNEAFTSYGGAADDWNASLTPADINDPDFGCVFGVTLNGDDAAGNSTAVVDSMRITVTYTATVGGSRRIITRNAGTITGAESRRDSHSRR